MKEIVKDARAAEQKSVTRNLSKREIEWRWARERGWRGGGTLFARGKWKTWKIMLMNIIKMQFLLERAFINASSYVASFPWSRFAFITLSLSFQHSHGLWNTVAIRWANDGNEIVRGDGNFSLVKIRKLEQDGILSNFNKCLEYNWKWIFFM